MRLFVGVAISMESVRAVAAVAEAMRAAAGPEGPPVRWVPPASYHVTLKFLGEARSEVVPALRDAVGEALAGEGPFTFRARGAGAFPALDRARVLWVGVDDPEGRLARLAAACDEAAARLGFRRERRAFHPHVTIGRLRQVANVESLVLPCTEQECSDTRATSVILYESLRKAKGSEYRARAEWPLRQTSRVEPTPTNTSQPPGRS